MSFLAAKTLILGIVLGLLASCGLGAVPVSAHDLWIGNQGLRNAAGEWCCGAGDCDALTPSEVTVTPQGYYLTRFKETVPFAEAMPSQDGTVWRCHRPDGSRRCFFYPPGSS
jgi:hypothetical protein